ncbi:hypothetical protein [Agarivorans aestuarii]|uniref:hypothetical protein n=1 Tax=Agarivorans aestuarii TaxID=1563703 RepID=UPI001C7EB67E|nr:hypothetical protein [Agarivorans aestuarii]
MTFRQLLLVAFSAGLALTVQAKELPPQAAEMMFELNEAAACMAAAKYLKNHSRVAVHQQDYQALVAEYQVPSELANSVRQLNHRQYLNFSERYDQRYPGLDKHKALTSAYTHRCYFMNEHETRRAAALHALSNND